MFPQVFRDLESDLFGVFEREAERAFAPALDVYEYDDRFEALLDVPGVAKSDLKIGFEDHVLTVEGERKSRELPEKASARCDRWAGRFTRSLRVPENADPASVAASLKDGVLMLTIKKTEAAKPRQIPIS